MQSLLEKLKSMIPAEFIDGQNVDEIAKLVDLDIEFTPVVAETVSGDPAKETIAFPVPCRVQMEGSRWCVWIPHTDEKYRWVNDEQLKVMRARFLLLKGFYFDHLESMCHTERSRVISHFFPGGVFKPAILMK